MCDVTEDNTFMRSSQSDASGFVMVVLLVCMGVVAVWMTSALPAWKQQATREKEAELAFRGQQYVRALGLYQRKNGPGSRPSSIDALVDGKFLRKKYKDPITGEDFLPMFTSSAPTAPGQPVPGQQTTPGRGGQPVPAVPAPSAQPGRAGAPGGAGQPGNAGTTFGGQIMGVTSKSTAASIRVYNGATHYNEWQFVAAAQGQQPGQGGPGGQGGPNNGRGGVPGPGGFGIGGGGNRGGAPGGPAGPGRGGAPGQVPAGPGRGRGGL